jgi:type VI secretion system protein ImpA
VSLARFLEPVSDGAPCGPDLLAADDDAYLDYYYGAIDRLPEKFFDTASGRPVDVSAIRIDSERAQVEALLARSRDLRPLAVLAQFAALTGRLPLLAEVLGLMAGLLERYPDAVHPATAEDNAERMTTLSLLDVQSTMALPLEFAVLANDKRLQRISFRRYAVSAGLRPPVGAETAEDAAAIVAALGLEGNKDEVEATHAALTAIADGLRRIADACLLADSYPFRPRFERTEPVVAQMLAMIAEARPDLGAAAETPAETATADGEDAPDTPVAAAMAPAAPTGPVTSQAAVRAALATVEGYFATHEPS